MQEHAHIQMIICANIYSLRFVIYGFFKAWFLSIVICALSFSPLFHPSSINSFNNLPYQVIILLALSLPHYYLLHPSFPINNYSANSTVPQMIIFLVLSVTQCYLVLNQEKAKCLTKRLVKGPKGLVRKIYNYFLLIELHLIRKRYIHGFQLSTQ